MKYRFEVGQWVYDTSGWHFWAGEIVNRGTVGAKRVAVPVYMVKARDGRIEAIQEQDAALCA